MSTSLADPGSAAQPCGKGDGIRATARPYDGMLQG